MMISARVTRRALLRAGSLLVVGCSQRIPSETMGDDTAGRRSDSGFAVVELFTSQGCSSCPSADENLARMARAAQDERLPVYTLSFHVDYWNQLGWEDPFSTATNTKRQQTYAAMARNKRVYTPQMIINGRVEFVGSHRDYSDRAVTAALGMDAEVKLRLEARRQGRTVAVQWSADQVNEKDVIQLALVQSEASRKVTAGENNGRSLRHVNVVRDFRSVTPPAGKKQGEAELVLPERNDAKDWQVIGYVQAGPVGVIRGAASKSLGASKP